MNTDLQMFFDFVELNRQQGREEWEARGRAMGFKAQTVCAVVRTVDAQGRVKRETVRVLGAPDLRIAGVLVDVKTAVRGALRPEYLAYMREDQLSGEAAEVFFASFQLPAGPLHLVGGMREGEFRARRRLVQPGERLPPKMTAVCETAVLPYAELEPPGIWLVRLIREGIPAEYAGPRGAP